MGSNPTFEGISRVVEAHVMDRPDEGVEDFDLYGQQVIVEFVSHLRPMVAYRGIEALIDQMAEVLLLVIGALGFAMRRFGLPVLPLILGVIIGPRAEDINIPKVTYCEPEIASVGYTEPKAKEKFGADSIETTEYNLAGNGKSSILGTSGIIKMVRVKNGPIVGVHGIGGRIGEQIGEAQLIVNWEAYPEDVAQLIHAHPTQNEALGEAAMALAGAPLHG